MALLCAPAGSEPQCCAAAVPSDPAQPARAAAHLSSSTAPAPTADDAPRASPSQQLEAAHKALRSQARAAAGAVADAAAAPEALPVYAAAPCAPPAHAPASPLSSSPQQQGMFFACLPLNDQHAGVPSRHLFSLPEEQE